MAGSYRDLVAWQKGMKLVTEVYRLTQNFPKAETYGLAGQLRRAAVSIPSNIAEGQAHFSRRDFRRFLRQARGSLAEVETQLLIAEDLGYLPNSQVTAILQNIAELGRVLNGLISSISVAEAGTEY